jgi:glc operon protein GlcG
MRIKSLLACALIAAAPLAGAQAQESRPVLTLATAKRIVAAATAEAEKAKVHGTIAVVDAGGWPLVLERSDKSANIASAEIAPGKARTAALFGKPTADFENAVNGPRAAVATAGFLMMEGGLPIEIDGYVVGAIGVSAGTKQQDTQVAQAGLAALKQP